MCNSEKHSLKLSSLLRRYNSGRVKWKRCKAKMWHGASMPYVKAYPEPLLTPSLRNIMEDSQNTHG
jgi:hypothetical protein